MNEYVCGRRKEGKKEGSVLLTATQNEHIWLFQKQEENKLDFGVILYCLDNFCLWFAHKRVLYVEHIFHFSSGVLPFFIGADKRWSKPIFLQRAIDREIRGPL